MFGPSILVAPYYEQQTLKRTVRLPRGNWYDFYTGEFVGNGDAPAAARRSRSLPPSAFRSLSRTAP